MKKLAMFLSLVAATLGLQAQPAISVETPSLAESQKLVPWQCAGERPVRVEMTTAFMSARPPRQVQSLHRNWTFYYMPESKLQETPAATEFDDATWPAVAIPHCWNNYETTRQLHPYILNATDQDKSFYGDRGGMGNITWWWDGWGWYRKQFNVIAPPGDKRAFLEFEGVMKYCRVYLNGKYLGEHKGGFTAFYFDVTDHLRTDRPNVLAVAVRNKLDDELRIPPMHSGNQTYAGGIYRDVRLVLKNPVHIPFQGSHEHEGGTYITSTVEGDVTARTWVGNTLTEPQPVTLRTTILDPSGKEVSRLETSQTIAPGKIQQFTQEMPDVSNPKLWSPESPDLYKVVSEVLVEGRLSDRFESPLGFRSFAWNYDRDVAILNGREIHIHGTNRTHDYPWINQAIPDWILIQDMRDIRFGQDHNFIRPNVHPNAPLLHDLCDQWGLLVNLSSPNIKNIDFSEEVQESTMREAIRRYRNHPSIVFYSIGNETNDGANSNWIHEEDPTRIIHARKVSGEGQGEHVQHTHENLDMEQLLRITIRGWTHDDVMPDRRPENGQQASTEQWQHQRACERGGSVRGRIDLNGVNWLYNDNGAARVYKNCPLKYINPKGWVDPYRIPKYIYFLWRALYAPEPMAFIHPHYWQEIYVGQKRDIIVDSNCDTVELFVNGRSQGTARPTPENFFSVTFREVPIERGCISVKGARGGKNIERKLMMASEPERLQLTATHKTFEAARDSLVVLTVDAVDRHGVQVQGFNRTLRWQVRGPASLVGPGKWETDINKNLANEGVWYMATPVCNLIRGTGRPGRVTVRVEAEGVEPAEVHLEAIKPEPKTDPIVEEPVLSNEGRRPIPWTEALVEPGRDSEDETVLMPLYFQDTHLEPGGTEKQYAKKFRAIVLNHAPDMKQYPAVLDALTTELSRICIRTKGTVVADDFNFLGGCVNECVAAIRALRKSTPKTPAREEREAKLIQRFLSSGKK